MFILSIRCIQVHRKILLLPDLMFPLFLYPVDPESKVYLLLSLLFDIQHMQRSSMIWKTI
jgi:hypothetical protein